MVLIVGDSQWLKRCKSRQSFIYGQDDTVLGVSRATVLRDERESDGNHRLAVILSSKILTGTVKILIRAYCPVLQTC
ncbi:hypothetical protein C2W62_11840 [Candidatus Entotheonella serta]|nr:hypothetical protein C2W62_11840 [Candidatus Entotheonella serta]